jgi:FAD/FMN-containing dehydrogenase
MTTIEHPTADLAALRARIEGEVITPGEQGWDEARQAYNLLLDQRPSLIAVPVDEADVIAVVGFAAEHGLRVVPQRTGHNAGPLGDLDGTVLLKTDAMTAVEIDAERRIARVQSGAKWEDVVPQASELGLAGLHGSTADVSLAGYSLGGGLSWYGRKHGLQTNNITAIELVTADGELRRVDSHNEPDLFWALRGGGGNFGVVTAIEFKLFPVAEVYAGVFFYPVERAAEVFHTWRELVPDMPDEMNVIARIMQFPPLEEVPEFVRGRSFAVVDAAFIGSEADGAELLKPLRDLGPEMDTFAMYPPAAIAELHMDPPDPIPYDSTHALLGELTAETVDELVALTGPDSGSPLVIVELRPLGGALARSHPDHGALDKFPGDFLMFAAGMVMDPAMVPAIESHLARVSELFAPYEAGWYGNFVEKSVDTSDFFPAETYRRLQAVKAEYDPEETFRANHEIRPVAS